jgi:hypothetical protein
VACLTLKYALRATLELSKQLKPEDSTAQATLSTAAPDSATASPAPSSSSAASGWRTHTQSPAQLQIQTIVNCIQRSLPTLLPPLYALVERCEQQWAAAHTAPAPTDTATASATATGGSDNSHGMSDKIVTLGVEILIMVWARFGHTIPLAERTRHFRLIRRRLACVRQAMRGGPSTSTSATASTAGVPPTVRILSFEDHKAPMSTATTSGADTSTTTSGGSGGGEVLDVRALRRQSARVEQWLLACTHAFWPALVAACTELTTPAPASASSDNKGGAVVEAGHSQVHRLLPFVTEYVLRYDDSEVRTSMLTTTGAILHAMHASRVMETAAPSTSSTSAAAAPSASQRLTQNVERCLSALLSLLQHNGAADTSLHLKLILAALRINLHLLPPPALVVLAAASPRAAPVVTSPNGVSALGRVLMAISAKITKENGGAILVPSKSAEREPGTKQETEESESGKDEAEEEEEEDEKEGGEWDDWDDDDPIVAGAGVDKLVPEFGAFLESLGQDYSSVLSPSASSSSASASTATPPLTVFTAQLQALSAPQRNPIEWLLQRFRQFSS